MAKLDAPLAAAYFLELIELFAEEFPDDWRGIKGAPFEEVSNFIAAQYGPDLDDVFPLDILRHERREARLRRAAQPKREQPRGTGEAVWAKAREAFSLRRSGLKHKDVAERLGISVGYAQRLAFRGKWLEARRADSTSFRVTDSV